jgi:uncharacterized protein
MGEQSVEVIKGVYDAFGRGDVPAVLEVWAEDLEWHEAEGMPYGGLHRGRDAVVRNVLGPLMEDVPDFKIVPEEFIASGNSVTSIVRYTGTAKATHKPLDLEVAHVWEVRDGKVTRFRQYADTVKFLEVVRSA